MNNLQYKIAWIDDQSIASLEKGLDRKLIKQGLALEVEHVATAEGLKTFVEKLQGRRDLDLILVDWKLGSMTPNGSGATVAKSIRDQQSYTDIVFYSASEPSVLRTQIADQKIDGVWCVNRNWFVDETWHVVEATLHRVDLNSMRGVFMSSVADFEHVMRGGLLQANSALATPVQERLARAFVQRRLEHLQMQAKAAEELQSETRLHELLKNAGTFELFALLQDLTGWVPAIDGLHAKALSVLANFSPEVIDPRNDLAHARSTGSMLTRAGRKYDVTRFGELRSKLLEHQENLDSVVRRLIPALVAKLNAELKNQG